MLSRITRASGGTRGVRQTSQRDLVPEVGGPSPPPISPDTRVIASPSPRWTEVTITRVSARWGSHLRARARYGQSSAVRAAAGTAGSNAPARGLTDLAHQARPRERESSRPEKRPPAIRAGSRGGGDAPHLQRRTRHVAGGRGGGAVRPVGRG